MMEKLSAPKHCEINLKAYKYDFGNIGQCKFTVRSIYLATPEQPLKKARTELFKVDGSSSSTALEHTKMQITPAKEDHNAERKKKN